MTGSRPLKGSSMMMSSGSCRSAAMNWIFCCMPLESSSVFLGMASVISMLLAPDVGALGGGGGVEAVELAEEDELVDDLHLLVEAALFGQIADAMKVLAVEGLVEELDRAGVGHGDADHHADGGGLAGAVGAEEAEHAAGLDAEAEVVDGDFGVVGFADLLEFNDGHGFS